MLNKFKHWRNSNYFKNFVALAGSEGIAQIIQIGVSPILTRVYSPLEFGQYELFKSIALLLVVFCFLQYDITIYTSKSEKESINALALSAILLLIICILAFIGIFFLMIFL